MALGTASLTGESCLHPLTPWGCHVSPTATGCPHGDQEWAHGELRHAAEGSFPICQSPKADPLYVALWLQAHLGSDGLFGCHGRVRSLCGFPVSALPSSRTSDKKVINHKKC